MIFTPFDATATRRPRGFATLCARVLSTARAGQVHGSSNRNREPRRTKLAARAAEWFWHAGGYIRFSADATVARGACADIIHACAGVRSPTHAKRAHTHTHTPMPPHVRATARGEVKSDEMENTHPKRTFHARRVFRLEEEGTGEDQRGHCEDYWCSVKDSK